MRKVDKLSDKLKKSILNLLYEDELFNTFIIHFLESENKSYGELYITEENEKISDVLYLKYDGNSYFTTFYTKSAEGIENIAAKLKNLEYKGVLVAGQSRYVSKIMDALDIKKDATKDIFYKLDVEYYKNICKHTVDELTKAKITEEDIEKIKRFRTNFFNVSTDEEIKEITNLDSILEDIKIGVYFIKVDDKTIGMARFSSKTRNYADITTVYIDEKYRGKGYGKKLIEGMTKIALTENKIPVIQTGTDNIAARKVYESIGFVKQGDYSFEFIS